MPEINPGDDRGLVSVPGSYPYAPNLAINSAIGLAKIFLTGNILILVPTNARDGCRLEIWLTADSTDRNLSFDESIVVQGNLDDDGNPTPFVVSAGTTAIITLRYDLARDVWWSEKTFIGY